jgi:tyrosinase
MRLRKNVWTIENDPADETLLWYGRAIGAMKALPLDDPLGLRFQAAIHGYRRRDDPFAVDGEPAPTAAERDKYWRQCEHNSWFFLPWHRMYLHHYEEIVAAHVEQLGGPGDWGLPYWNYNGDAASRFISPSFRQPTLADGSPNPLFVGDRDPAANAGTQPANNHEVNLDCLRFSTFAGPSAGGLSGFGGSQAGSQHAGGSVGGLEATPHGSMHMYVDGWMSSFDTTGLDPLFYCHHCNIDRLWEVWLERDTNHENPAQQFWERGVSFPFRTAAGGEARMVSADVVDIENQLGYLYEDVSDPLGGAPDVFGLGAVMASFPEMIGASRRSIDVRSDGATHTVITAPKGRPGESFGASTQTQRVYLHLENLTCEGPARAIEVYVGTTPGEEPSPDSGTRVARFPLFGIREATRADGPHSGSGLTFATEITPYVRQLADDPDSDVLEIQIAFRPVGNWGDTPVRVGRVSLYAENE